MTPELDALLQEIRKQWTRRKEMYASAGGNPDEMDGDLTCYLPHAMLRAALAAAPASSPDNPPCALCGGPHPFDTTVPSVRWNHVIRRAGLPDYLCLTCIVSAFVQAGESFTAELIGGDHHCEPIEIRTRSQNAIDAQTLSAENTTLRAQLQQLAASSPCLCCSQMQPCQDGCRCKVGSPEGDV